MWPRVWPGVSITRRLRRRRASPCRPRRPRCRASAGARRPRRAPTTGQSKRARSASTPAMWSSWWWVSRMRSSRPPCSSTSLRHRIGVGGVDHRDGAERLVAQIPGVVVGEDGDRACGDGHAGPVPCAGAHDTAASGNVLSLAAMAADVHSAADFYGTPCGGMTARLLRERLATIWPELPGQSVLGLGYAAPYLRLWREERRALHRADPGADRRRALAGRGSPTCPARRRRTRCPSPISASTASCWSMASRAPRTRGGCCARCGAC